MMLLNVDRARGWRFLRDGWGLATGGWDQSAASRQTPAQFRKVL